MKGRMIPRVAMLLVLAFLAAGAVAQQPPPVSAADGEAVFVLVLQPQRAGEAPFDVARLGGTLHHRSGPRLAVTLPESAVDGLRHNPQVRYIQRMVIGPPPVTAAENVQPAWPEAAAPPPPPSAFRVSASATTSWTTGSYTYDGSGNISGIGPGTELQTNAYTYDRIGRLSSATIYNGTRKHEESYVHDSAGNLTQLTKDGVTLSFPVDQATNRLAASLAAYDAVGNTTWMAGAGAYTYDQLGMIASNDVDAYIYTADDERLAVGRMPEDPTWRWTLRDLNGRVVRELESFGPQKTSQYFVWVEDHFFGDGVLVASEREVAEGGRRHFHVDHLGTPRMVTDAGGNRVSAHVYAPYGRELTSVQQERARGFSREQPLRFTGHERDGLNDISNEEHTQYLDYMHARFYNPNWGRFLSVDPNAFWELQHGSDEDRAKFRSYLRHPQRWNRYSYVSNNPINKIDPDGREENFYMKKLFREQQMVGEGLMSTDTYWARRRSEGVGALIGTVGAVSWVAGARLLAFFGGSSFAPAVSTAGATLTPAMAARINTVNEIVHNWSARSTLQATGQVLAQHAQKIREGAAGLQKAADALQNSLKNPNLDPRTRAVLENALNTAQKYIREADAALRRLR